MSHLKNTVLLTGLPRAGTTLCCHILNSYSNVLALHEPLTPSELNAEKGALAAVNHIRQFAESTREKALHEGVIISRQKGGKVPENPVSSMVAQNGLRQIDVALGEMDVTQNVQNEEFTLVIKHNALFTSLLPELANQFDVYGIVRNPLAVLASWNLVDLPVNQGRVPAGEMFSAALKNELDAEPDKINRQLIILEWFCNIYAQYLPERVMRYEDFVVSPQHVGRVMGLSNLYNENTVARESRNSTYDIELMSLLYKRLMNFGDAIWQFYSRDQVNTLMETIRSES